MKLSFDRICSITTGAVRLLEKEDGIHFYRFTPEQQAYYQQFPNYYAASFSTAGIRLQFRTDSPFVKLKVQINPASTRKFFALDVYANSVFIGDIRNYEELQLMRKYTLQDLPIGEFEKQFDLGDGEKDVVIYLPWGLETVLKELALADDATVTPIHPKKKLLCFGDSITMGHDALHPPRRYTAQLADYLGYEEFNKGIGGERFPPELALTKEDFIPDIITVAYGTNDWRHRQKADFERACRNFFTNLRSTYPDTPIFAIAPVWRSICMREYDCGPFRQIPVLYREVAKDIPNMTVIDAFGFIPPQTDYYADLTLHPNGAGFDRYFEGLKPYFESYRA